jgi:hypothetical protein
MHRKPALGICVEMANPIATPTPTLTPLRPGTSPETRFHSLVNTPVPAPVPVPEPVPVPRVASKNSCLWRIIFVMFPLNDGDTETLDEDIDWIVIIIYYVLLDYYLINNDK